MTDGDVAFCQGSQTCLCDALSKVISRLGFCWCFILTSGKTGKRMELTIFLVQQGTIDQSCFLDDTFQPPRLIAALLISPQAVSCRCA